MSPKVKQELMKKKEEFEGRVPWMYRDQNGWLTIGIGHNLQPDRRPATEQSLTKQLKKVIKHGMPVSMLGSSDMVTRWHDQCPTAKSRKVLGTDADPFEKLAVAGTLLNKDGKSEPKTPGVWGFELPVKDDEADFLAVMIKEGLKIAAAPFGQVNARMFYLCLNSFELKDETINSLLESDIDAILSSIKNDMEWDKSDKNPSKHFKKAAYPDLAGFDDFPEQVQAAFVDLAFQHGLTGAYSIGKGKFRAYLKERRWEEAGAILPTQDTQQARITWRKSLFEQAAKTDPKAKKPPPPEEKPKTQ